MLNNVIIAFKVTKASDHIESIPLIVYGMTRCVLVSKKINNLRRHFNFMLCMHVG